MIVKTILEYVKENVDPAVGEHMMKHVADRKGHDRRYGIDPEKIKRDLGWYPETTFEVGIKKTIQWYLNHKEWMENVTSGAIRSTIRGCTATGNKSTSRGLRQKVFSLAATSALHV